MCSYHSVKLFTYEYKVNNNEGLKSLLKNKLTHTHRARQYWVKALWDDICGNSFRIHFNALCKPKCQSSFLVTFHDFMSHIKRCSFPHNGLFNLHYHQIFPSKENKPQYWEIISFSYLHPAEMCRFDTPWRTRWFSRTRDNSLMQSFFLLFCLFTSLYKLDPKNKVRV